MITKMTHHETLVDLFSSYLKEHEKFTEKGNKAAGTRARKALAEFAKVSKDRRKEIQDSKISEKLEII
jgi:hypothetical protein